MLTHVVEGRLNKQIAGELGTVEKTIKVHRARMMEKMKVRSVAELVRLMERAGIRPTPRPSSWPGTPGLIGPDGSPPRTPSSPQALARMSRSGRTAQYRSVMNLNGKSGSR